MKKNYDRKTKMYRFVKVNVVDTDSFTFEDVSVPVFFDEQTIVEFIHIKDNLYGYNGDFYIPSNY